MNNNLVVSTSPHIHRHESTATIMWAVVIALIPSGIGSVWIFGLSALWVILTGVLSAVVFEVLIQRLRGQEVSVLDGSAVLTGLLLTYNLPPVVPLWIPVVGSFFAIAIVKHAFGGLGRNIFNPALAGRAFLLAAWPTYMTTFHAPYDALTTATPLALLKEGKILNLAEMNLTYGDLFFGGRAGCIGEVCIGLLILGAIFLWVRGVFSLHAPFAFIATLALFSWAFGGTALFSGDWIFAILSGGLILGAFFMATDYVTTPLTLKGQAIFGIGCGLITFVIRKWGGYPEGVSYSILMMNAFTPLIDRYVRPKRY
ncbi:MAG TPA: RnfABCDGE type electron transport complex subunit D [Candidatus Omnitrophica bacterium]|nr:RnfABCDGE type electron transport complex subunit D [Candidatus Omnitrophota bacterium]